MPAVLWETLRGALGLAKYVSIWFGNTSCK